MLLIISDGPKFVLEGAFDVHQWAHPIILAIFLVASLGPFIYFGNTFSISVGPFIVYDKFY
jgi:hypothetical protein